MQKNDRISTLCLRLGSEMEGVCKYENRPVFVPGVLPGEEADVLIVKTQDRYAFGRLMGIAEPSPDRTEPFCPVYDKCGGCSAQHMTYEAGLHAKRDQIEDCFRRIAGIEIPNGLIPPLLPAADPCRSRNKTALPVGGTASDPKMGFYRRRSHDIIDITDCPIAMGSMPGVVEAVRAWIIKAHVQPYNELTGKGLLRHVVTRVSRAGRLMVILTASKDALPDVPLLVSLLQEKAEGFCSLHISVQPDRTNVILGRTSRCLWGEEYITEELLGLTFEIPPLSFFQVNPEQTEVLYAKAIELAQLKKDDLVVDAYCGAGTISLCMAKQAARVIGIEIVPQAIEGARRNAARNDITNAEFIVDAVEKRLPVLVKDGLRPDVIVLDPPRKGVEAPVVEAVLAAKPRRIVYVSCHVPTQARDVALLCEGGYRVEACQPVDMFCYSGGAENIISMILKEDQ